MTLGTAALPVALTIAYIATTLTMRRLRVPSATFRFNLDHLDPRNYRPAGRWLIPLAVLLAVGALAAWARAFAG
jgi:hypothetical protein